MISSRGSAVWDGTTVKKILTNVTYTGNRVATFKSNDLLNKGKATERQSYYIENNHQAIIDLATFEEVQKRIQATEYQKNMKKAEFRSLSSRILCGLCGCNYQFLRDYATPCWRCRKGKYGMEICSSYRLYESELLEMMKEAFKKRFDTQTLKDIFYPMKRHHEQDQYEQRRLLYFSRLRLIREMEKKAPECELPVIQDKKKELEEELFTFESHLKKIEKDRPYREESIAWMKSISSLDDFFEQATIDRLRAWIVSMTIYSKDLFLVQWYDQQETQVGEGDTPEPPKTWRNLNHAKEQSRKGEDVIVQGKEVSQNEVLAQSEAIVQVVLIDQGDGRIQSDVIPKDDTLIQGDTFSQSDAPVQDNVIIKDDALIQSDVIAQDNTFIQGDTLAQNDTHVHRDALTSTNKAKINTPAKGYLTRQIKKENIIKVEQAVQRKQLEKPKLRTASYCRVSTEKDPQQISLESQVAYYTYLILKNPDMSFAGIFADKGLSGTKTKNRTEFNRLMQKCKEGKIDLILTKSISRFSRNTVDALSYARMLKSLDPPVHIHFERENINTADEDSELMLTILSSMAQEEAVSLGSSSQWAKQKLAEQGIVNVSRVPYGYDLDEEKNWVINPEQADVVRRIFRSYLNEKSSRTIARELSEEKIESASGNNYWHQNSVDCILQSIFYKGCYLYQKTYSQDAITQKRLVNKGELPQYYIEDHHPAIIPPDDWDAAQELREVRKAKVKITPKERREPQNFHKIFRCSQCGGKLSPHTQYNHQDPKKGAKHYWRCLVARGKNNFAKCNVPSFRQEYLEHNFMTALLEMKANERFQIEAEAVAAKTDLTSEELAEVKAIKAKMEQLNQELYEAVDEELNKAGQDTKKVEALTAQIVKCKEQLDEYEERKEKAEKYRDELKWLMKELEDLEEFDPLKHRVDFRADIFERLVESGVVHPDGRIVYTLSTGVEWECYLEEKRSYKLKVKGQRKERVPKKK
ncbi:recombinase family protein [Heliorestis acidaminivorans]|uniref:recombinase family protein n=1 Tax=Heliorestis acidaminivorans TaxID=553427 RepID=UPI0014794D96|nr:recombinase family protein [Heliorestis acidaminivorans]